MTLTLTTRLILSVLAGALAPLALAPFSLWPLAPLSVLLFWWLLQSAPNTTTATLAGLSYGLGYFGVGVSWVFVSMVDHSETHWAIAAILTFLFCGGLALFYAALTWLFHRFKHLHQHPCLLFIGLWLCLDLVRGWLLTGFPWLYLGYGSLHTYLAGYAPVLGVHGLTLFSVSSAVLIYSVLTQPLKTKLLNLALLLSVWVGGWGLTHVQWSQPSQTKPIQVTLLQGNIALEDKWLPEHLAPSLGYYLEHTYKHLNSDLIVWPETAIATYWDYIANAMDNVTATAQENNTQIISGTVIREHTGLGAGYYNSLVAIGHNSQLDSTTSQGFYHKQRLVPFGE